MFCFCEHIAVIKLLIKALIIGYQCVNEQGVDLSFKIRFNLLCWQYFSTDHHLTCGVYSLIEAVSSSRPVRLLLVSKQLVYLHMVSDAPPERYLKVGIRQLHQSVE